MPDTARRASPSSTKPTPGASSAGKVLRLLTYFSPERTHARVEELAAFLDLPKSTSYRYLSLLREVGMVTAGTDGRWSLAPLMIRLGQAAIKAVGIIDAAMPSMEQLSHRTQETVLLIERNGDSGVCVAKYDAPQLIRLSFEVGTAVPLHRGAGAKLLLAHLSPGAQQDYLERAAGSYVELAGRVGKLKAALTSIRNKGYSISVGDLEKDLWSLSAPIRQGDAVIAALSLVGPVYRMPLSAEEKLSRLVRRSADDISTAIARQTAWHHSSTAA